MHDPEAKPLFLRFTDRDVGYLLPEQVAEIAEQSRQHFDPAHGYLWGAVHSALIEAVELNAAGWPHLVEGKNKNKPFGKLTVTDIGDGVMRYNGLLDLNPMASVIFAYLKTGAEDWTARRIADLKSELAMLEGK